MEGNGMKKVLKTIGFVILYIVISTVIILGAQIAFKKIPFFNSLYATTKSPAAFFCLSDCILLVVYFLFFAIFRRKYNFLKYCSFTKINLPKMLISALTGILLGLFTFSLINITYIRINFPDLYNCIIYFIAPGYIIPLLILVTTNSIYKELAFRGLIFNEMRYNKFPVWLAVFIQALLYCLLAGTGKITVLGVYGFLGALVFCILFYLAGSIWASIIAQFFATMSLSFYTRVASGMFNSQNAVYILVFSIAALVVVFLALGKSFRGAQTTVKVTASAGREG
jgi:membrane protease YdiL (CAAX protease family)